MVYTSTRDSGRCSPWRWRDVDIHADEYAAARQYAASTTVVMPSIVGKVTGRDGFALPWFIGVQADHADDISLLAHETAHLYQMRRDGVIPYTANYLRDLFVGVWHGCDAYASYMAVAYERQAHIVGNVTANRERQAEWAENYRHAQRAGVRGDSSRR